MPSGILLALRGRGGAAVWSFILRGCRGGVAGILIICGRRRGIARILKRRGRRGINLLTEVLHFNNSENNDEHAGYRRHAHIRREILAILVQIQLAEEIRLAVAAHTHLLLDEAVIHAKRNHAVSGGARYDLGSDAPRRAEYTHLSEAYTKERAKVRAVFVFHDDHVRGTAQSGLQISHAGENPTEFTLIRSYRDLKNDMLSISLALFSEDTRIGCVDSKTDRKEWGEDSISGE